MAELALPNVDPLRQRRAVRLALGVRQVAEARIVQWLDTRRASAVPDIVGCEGSTRPQPLEPQRDVVGQPAVADVLAVLVIGEVKTAAQTATLVTETVVLAVRASVRRYFASLAKTFTSARPSCSAAISRSLYFWILPDAVCGYESTKKTYLGHL